MFEDKFPTHLYHSYIIETDDVHGLTIDLQAFLEQKGDIEPKSPDVIRQTYDSFTINDVPIIKEWHSSMGIGSGKKVCIIGTKFINHDAERALLKILEEPASSTHFFMIVPDASMLLDTIRSRAHVVTVRENSILKENDTDAFMKSGPKERIDMVAMMIKKHEDDENSGGLRFEAIDLINKAERSVYNKFQKEKNNKDTLFVLEELAKARSYLAIPGASVKMILEHIALML